MLLGFLLLATLCVALILVPYLPAIEDGLARQRADAARRDGPPS